jgi:hypothetical protein
MIPGCNPRPQLQAAAGEVLVPAKRNCEPNGSEDFLGKHILIAFYPQCRFKTLSESERLKDSSEASETDRNTSKSGKPAGLVELVPRVRGQSKGNVCCGSSSKADRVTGSTT